MQESEGPLGSRPSRRGTRRWARQAFQQLRLSRSGLGGKWPQVRSEPTFVSLGDQMGYKGGQEDSF